MSRENGRRTYFARTRLLLHRLFSPQRPDRIEEERIALARRARSALGLLATAWLFLGHPLHEGLGGLIDGQVQEMAFGAATLLVVGPLALLAFLLAARPDLRGTYLRRLKGPAVAFGAVGVFFGFYVEVICGKWDPTVLSDSWVWDLPLTLAYGLLSLWWIVTGIAGGFLAVHHTFRVADVHEVLPPLLSPVLVWTLFVVQFGDGLSVSASLPVRMLFTLGPALSVTALSLWELRTLRALYGITVRGALGREARTMGGLLSDHGE